MNAKSKLNIVAKRVIDNDSINEFVITLTNDDLDEIATEKHVTISDTVTKSFYKNDQNEWYLNRYVINEPDKTVFIYLDGTEKVIEKSYYKYETAAEDFWD